MTRGAHRLIVFAAAGAVAACTIPDTKMGPTPVRTGAIALELADVMASPTGIAAWILAPPDLPAGWVGKSNCTFLFGPLNARWDFHPEGGCWEHPGPDGWTRQQFQRVHVPSFASCGGGPGDATAIRVCRTGGQGQPSPCPIDALTGPTGCARCVVNPQCH